MNTLFHTFLTYSLLFMQLFLKIPSGMANSVAPDQTAPEGFCTVCTCHFVKNFGLWNFRTFTVSSKGYGWNLAHLNSSFGILIISMLMLLSFPN